MAASRDRIAPNCTIRRPVRPIVALQRRVRFSAPLAGFSRIRCHQRRARRPEQASFLVWVSNLDFRVPRLRQIGERAADRAIRVAGKEAAREAQNRGRGYCRVVGLARSGPGVALASLMSIFAQDLDPGRRPGSVASRCWTVFSLRVRRTRIADIASDTPLIWGSPRVDDDRNGPARQS